MLCSGFGWILEQLPAPHDPEDSVSEVVYNWLQGGNKDGGAVYSQDAACCCSDCCQVRRGQGAVHRNYHYHHKNNYHPWAAAVCPGGRNKLHCSLESVQHASRSVRGSCNVLIYSHRFSTINNFSAYCQLSMYLVLIWRVINQLISRFHFTLHKIQLYFSSCVNARTSSSSIQFRYYSASWATSIIVMLCSPNLGFRGEANQF